MVNRLNQIICVIFLYFSSNTIQASSEDMTIKNLITGERENFHLRVLESIPKNGLISIGPENAKNIIIEFFDYKCGFCVKMHPELIQLVEQRNDTKVVFIQYPILSQTSVKLARLVLAANYQGKGFEIHHSLLTEPGQLNEERINKIINESKIDSSLLVKDLERKEIEETLSITAFIAAGIGARGTPAVFINDKFNPGYVPKNKIEELLN